MAVEVYLGYPPENIRTWIEQHVQPSELGVPLYFEGQESGATVAMIAWDGDNWEPFEHLQCHL